MSGRHRAEPSGAVPTGRQAPAPRPAGTPPGRMRRALALLVAANVVLAAATVTARLWPRPARPAASDRGCVRGVPLHVVVAPVLAPPVHLIVNRWLASNPAVNRICIDVSVATVDSRAAEQMLVTTSTATIWLPESTVWSSRLVSDAPGLAGHISVGRSVASSPLVLAAAPSRAAGLAAVARQGWASSLTSSTAVAVPDPATELEGVLALLGLQAEADSAAGSSAILADQFGTLADHVVPSASAGFATMRAAASIAPPFVATEQQVLAANRGAPKPIATAVYPAGPNAGLDFPMVTITPSPTKVYLAAVQQFAAELATPDAVHVLTAAGLRDADASAPGDHSDGATTGDQPVSRAPAATPARMARAERLWIAARAPGQLLAVIDVSGSMNDDSGDGQAKIQVASQAAATAISLVPDNWSVGLWAFSRKPPPAADWTQLVPLESMVAGRRAVVAALHGLPALVEGDTGLYDTVLAAFERVSNAYDPHKANSVVLMTDGANVDPGGIDLRTLLAKLRQKYDRSRPVQVITIAFGSDADVAALRQISAATGGVTYLVRRPEEIQGVFLKSIVHRS